MKRTGVLLVLLLVQALLAGCGFHLRGGESLGSTQVTVLRMDDQTKPAAGWTGDGPGALARSVRETLGEGGIAFLDDAPLALVLLEETFDKRVASVARTAGAGEYQIDYALRWRVNGNDGAALVRDATARASGSYRYKANAIMGSAEEDVIIQRELRHDAARQVLRQLRLALAARARAGEPAQRAESADGRQP